MDRVGQLVRIFIELNLVLPGFTGFYLVFIECFQTYSSLWLFNGPFRWLGLRLYRVLPSFFLVDKSVTWGERVILGDQTKEERRKRTKQTKRGRGVGLRRGRSRDGGDTGASHRKLVRNQRFFDFHGLHPLSLKGFTGFFYRVSRLPYPIQRL